MIRKRTMRLSELCNLVSIQVDPRDRGADLYIGLEHLASRRFERVGAGSASDVQSSKYAFQNGDVLYGKLRPYLDKAILASDTGICTTELLVLRPKEGVDPRFLVSVVHSPRFVEHAMAGSTGVQHPRTSWNHICDFELPVFGSEEQRKIGDFLWKVHHSICASEAVIRTGSDLKQAAMRVLFTRGMRGEAQSESEIGPIPGSWDVVPLGSLGRIGNGSTPKKAVREYWEGGTFPWLTSAKVYDRDIVSADQFVTDIALRECHLPKVGPGAILIAITGQGKTLGHCAVLRMTATVNQHIAYLALDTDRAHSSFVRGYLETRYDYLRQVGAAGGSTKGALTCAFLRTMPIPLPRTLDEQQEIVTVLEGLDCKLDSQRRKLIVLEALFQSLLHNLIMGDVRITNLNLSASAPKQSTEVTA